MNPHRHVATALLASGLLALGWLAYLLTAMWVPPGCWHVDVIGGPGGELVVADGQPTTRGPGPWRFIPPGVRTGTHVALGLVAGVSVVCGLALRWATPPQPQE